jgi:hypothetical protein
VATLGHNDIALVVDRRKIPVCLVASALNLSSFHHSSFPLFLVLIYKLAIREKTGDLKATCMDLTK